MNWYLDCQEYECARWKKCRPHYYLLAFPRACACPVFVETQPTHTNIYNICCYSSRQKKSSCLILPCNANFPVLRNSSVKINNCSFPWTHSDSPTYLLSLVHTFVWTVQSFQSYGPFPHLPELGTLAFSLRIFSCISINKCVYMSSLFGDDQHASLLQCLFSVGWWDDNDVGIQWMDLKPWLRRFWVPYSTS